MSTGKSLLFFLTVFFLAFIPLQVTAGISGQVAADFQPTTGVIIMPVDNEFLIDLGVSSGVNQGDLFSVLAPGKQIIHPLTQEVLGTLDKVGAILKVTRIKDRYSHARVVSGELDLKPGDTVSRFTNISAGFWDYTGQGQELFTDLLSALPHLEWQTYDAAQAERPALPQAVAGKTPMLVFVLESGQLRVRDRDFQILRSYVTTDQPRSPSPAETTTDTASRSGTSPMPSAIVASAAETQQHKSIIRRDQIDSSQIWTALELKGNPVALEIGDFDGDGNQEYAILLPDKLTIVRLVNGVTEVLATFSQEWADKYLTMDSIDLNGDGISDLYITAASSHEIASLVYGFRQDRFQLLQHSIPFYLRKVHVATEGDLLLGQRMGEAGTDFSSPIVRMKSNNDTLESGDPIQIPWGAEIFGITTIRSKTATPLFVTLSRTGHLQVQRTEGSALWESSKPFGGSQLNFSRLDQSGGSRFSTIPVIIKPRLETIEKEVILVPLNEGGGVFDFFTNRGPGRVVALQWDGQHLQELWHTQPQNGYLADFRYADIDNDGTKELVKLINFSRSGFLKEGRAALIVYEIE